MPLKCCYLEYLLSNIIVFFFPFCLEVFCVDSKILCAPKLDLKNQNLITITNGSLEKTMMAWVTCFWFKGQDNTQGSKERTQTKKREIVKVEFVSFVMCDAHLKWFTIKFDIIIEVSNLGWLNKAEIDLKIETSWIVPDFNSLCMKKNN